MSQDTKTGSETLNMDQFNPKKAELIALAEKHKAATEIQIVDKASYDKVHEAQIELRDTRNAIKDQWLAIRDSANKFIKQVTAAEKELLALIVPTEDILIAKKEEWKKKEEEEKERKRKEQEELANKRVQELAQYWYIHDLFDLKIMEESDFQTLLSEKKTAFEEAEKAKKDAEAAAQKKQERINKINQIWLYWQPALQAYYSNELQKIVITQEAFEDSEDWVFEEILKTVSGELDQKRAEIKKQQDELAAKNKEMEEREAALKKKEDEQKQKEAEQKKQEEIAAAAKKAAEDTEARLKKEADDKKAAEEKQKQEEAEAKAKEEKKLALEKKYKEFLASIWYKKEEEADWKWEDTPEWRVFFKKVWTFKK